jgi:small conductance mechanosensitive channel
MDVPWPRRDRVNGFGTIGAQNSRRLDFGNGFAAKKRRGKRVFNWAVSWGSATRQGRHSGFSLWKQATDSMNSNTNGMDFFERIVHNTPAGSYWHNTSVVVHAAIILGLAFLVHLVVKIIHRASEWLIKKSHARKSPFGYVAGTPKFITVARLAVSAVTFAVYFITVGLVVIAVFHFNDTFLKTYLSSAAVVGLALSFGLQGLVQDVVTGVTLILSNAMDAGDIVDLSGTVGRVEQIGLRFTKVINFYNQEIFVPNRNIANVARFPREGVYAYADIQFSRQADQEKVAQLVREVAIGVWAQFGAIILTEPEVGAIETAAPGGWNYLRVQFKVWPGQTLIETAFRPQMVSAMKSFDPNYADWMVPVTYRAISGRQDKAALGEGVKVAPRPNANEPVPDKSFGPPVRVAAGR